MWYEIEGLEFKKLLKRNWYAQFFTDGKKIYRWFGGGEHMDMFNLYESRGGIPPLTLRVVEQESADGMHLYTDKFGKFISLGIWTKCDYPNFNWLKGAKFDELNIEILAEDGAVIETCTDPISGSLAINLGGKITAIEEFEEGAVRIGWSSSMYWY